jgi:hypothetical protein
VRGWDKNLPVASAQRAAQTLLAQATPTLGLGSAGPPVALCRKQEYGHAEPLAVDLGRR